MTTEKHPTSARHRRTHGHSSTPEQKISGILLFMILPLAILLVVRLFHGDLKVALSGAVAVTGLHAAVYFRKQSLFFLSVLGLLAMIMAVIWRWTDFYMIRILSSEIIKEKGVLFLGIISGTAPVVLVTLYYLQLRKMKLKVKYEWYSSRLFREFVSILIVVFSFLVLLWIFGYFVHKIMFAPFYDKTDASVIAAVAALVVVAYPGYLIFLKSRAETRPVSRRHRSHRSRV